MNLSENPIIQGLQYTATVLVAGAGGYYAKLIFINSGKPLKPLKVFNELAASMIVAYFVAPPTARILANQLKIFSADDLGFIGFMGLSMGIIAAKLVAFIHGIDLKKVFHAINPWKNK